MEEIIGKLAGSVFQDSYIGLQIRTRVTPRNPQTNYQQLRRGEFGYLAGTWRNLTTPQKDTWVAEAGSTPEAVRLFVQQNINLTLIEQPLITSHVSAPIPPVFPIEASSILETEFFVFASTALTVVPAGQSVLFFVTYEKAQTKMFTNPSEFSPILTFPELTDLATPVDVLAQWQSRYGQLVPNKRLCIKSVLIDNASGYRSPDSVQCYNVPLETGNFIIDADATFLVDSDGTFIIYP